MFAFLDSPVEIGIIVLVVLLLFGGSQLPKLAKNLGQAQKEFKDGLAAGQQTDAAAASAQVAQASAAQAVAAAPQIPVVPPPAAVPMNDAARAEELRQLEARMAELKGEPPAPSAN